jgi:hypothetical protein
VRPEWLMADVSCDCMGVVWPYDGMWLRWRFWPLWNVERLGTLRGNGDCRLLTAGDTGGPRPTPLLQQWME